MKVLIVDDEDILRITLCDDLKDAGFEADCFENPLLAFEFLKKENIDVIITDLKMNEMDGISFLKIIKERYPEISVIMMTAVLAPCRGRSSDYLYYHSSGGHCANLQRLRLFF